MATLFADLPEALENSVEIARRLNLEIKLGKPSLPAYPVPAGQTTEEHLREESKLGLEQRWPVIADAARHARSRATTTRAASPANSTSSARWDSPVTS